MVRQWWRWDQWLFLCLPTYPYRNRDHVCARGMVIGSWLDMFLKYHLLILKIDWYIPLCLEPLITFSCIFKPTSLSLWNPSLIWVNCLLHPHWQSANLTALWSWRLSSSATVLDSESCPGCLLFASPRLYRWFWVPITDIVGRLCRIRGWLDDD